MAQIRAEVYKSHTGFGMKQKWYWRIRAANGQIVAIGGEGYYSKWNAKRAVKRSYPEMEIVSTKEELGHAR